MIEVNDDGNIVQDHEECESITLDQASMRQLFDLMVAAWILCPPTSKEELIQIYTQMDELLRDIDRAIYRSKPEPLPD